MAPSPRTVALAVCLLGVALCAIALAPAALSADSDVVASPTSEPEPTAGLALPERVVLDGETRHGSARVDRDVSASIDRGGTRLDGAYEQHLLEAELDRTENEEERRAELAEWARRLNRSVLALDERERRARQAYVRGERSPRSLLVELRAVNDRAAQVEQTSQVIQQEADRLSASSVDNQIEALQGDLIARQGPVRDRVAEHASDDSAGGRIYVSAAANGTVLATIEDGSYHREATRTDMLVARGTNGVAHTEMFPITTEHLYPDHYQHYDFDSVARTVVLFQVYQIRAHNPETYPHGELRSYVDGVSQSVFWEYQRLDLHGDLPVLDPSVGRNGDLSVSVERTYPGGPARVTVEEDGGPVSGATIRIDGVAVGDTNAAGEDWVVVPEDASTLEATVGDSTADVDLP